MSKGIIVGHEHIMDEHCIPPKFIGSRFLQKIVNKFTLPIVLFLDILNPFSKKDVLSRYASFIKNENKTQSANLKELQSYYSEDSDIVILTVNMNGMGAGQTKKSYEDQLKEVINLKLAGNRIKVFYHLDPTINESLDLLYKYSEHIDGLKVYTLMGHFPYDYSLLKAYEWCAKYDKPVVFHTSPESPVYYKGKKKELKKRLRLTRLDLYDKDRKKRDLCRNFTNPRGYEIVLKMFPSVNFDFAHLAGEEEIDKHLWGEYSMASEILDYCKKYDNAYFDTSFSFHSEVNQKFLLHLMRDDKIKGKVLYGTDFYMNKTVAEQKSFIEKMKNIIGVMNYRLISVENPKRFHNQ